MKTKVQNKISLFHTTETRAVLCKVYHRGQATLLCISCRSRLATPEPASDVRRSSLRSRTWWRRDSATGPPPVFDTRRVRMALQVQLKTESIFETIGLPTQALLADSRVESRSCRCCRCLDRLCDTCTISGRTGTLTCNFYTGQCTSACACLSLAAAMLTAAIVRTSYASLWAPSVPASANLSVNVNVVFPGDHRSGRGF